MTGARVVRVNLAQHVRVDPNWTFMGNGWFNGLPVVVYGCSGSGFIIVNRWNNDLFLSVKTFSDVLALLED